MTSKENLLPKLGHVKKTCQQWGLREDGALAQRLQSQEINEYYNRNKERNAMVREDFPKALSEQKREEEVANEVQMQYRQYLENVEKADRDLAEQMEKNLKIEKLRNEEIEAIKAKEIARRLQKIEQQAERERIAAIEAEENAAKEFALKLQIMEQQREMTQAERDRLLAIQAQNEELAEKDRMLAIQAQDEELAKLLQERERKRAKRLKEKYRLKKSQQQQQQQQQLLDQSNTVNSATNDIQNHRPDTNVVSTNNNYDLEETYSDPVDLIRTNDIVDNYRNGAIPKSKRPIPNIPYEQTFDSDDTYALPIDIKGYNSIPNVKDYNKKPILPKPNSLYDLQSSSSNRNDGNFIHHPRFDYPPSPGFDGPSSSIGNGSLDGKIKKDKREKCTHQ